MNIDKPVSTFEAFCKIIADYARGHDDFALLLTENVPECRELGAIPEDKIVMTEAAAHAALLRAAGLALAGVKPWVLGRSLELVGGSYAQIREAVAMPRLPIRIAAIDGGFSSASDGAAKQLFSDIACRPPEQTAHRLYRLPAILCLCRAIGRKIILPILFGQPAVQIFS